MSSMSKLRNGILLALLKKCVCYTNNTHDRKNIIDCRKQTTEKERSSISPQLGFVLLLPINISSKTPHDILKLFQQR